MSPKRTIRDVEEPRVESLTVPPSRSNEAGVTDWDRFYRSAIFPWRSAGVGEVARELLTAARGKRLLEIGCGLGDDAKQLIELGFEYSGIDFSEAAISRAKNELADYRATFHVSDFFSWSAPHTYNVVYEKGFFHGLSGPRRRREFALRTATVLGKGGIWICICGAAEYPGRRTHHGAVFLTHLIEAVEPYFEVLQVVKAPYGTLRSHDFPAWHGLFRPWQ